MRDTKSLFLPIMDNGGGDVKLKYMEGWIQAVGTLNFTVATSADSLITRARNIVTSAFLKSDREYIHFWDADIIATRQHMELLSENDDDIICGIYCKKNVGLEPEPVFNTLENGIQICGGLVEIARGGTGFMRIHRSVFEAMKRPEIEYDNHGELQWDFWPVGVVNREYLSEDWYFCDIARKLGFKVMLDTRIQTLHIGQCNYPIDWRALGLVKLDDNKLINIP